MTKFVFLPDAHVGFDVWHTEEGMVRKPTHDLGMIRLAAKFIKDFEPNLIIFGGDQLNSASVGRWNKDKPAHFLQNTYLEEIDICKKQVLAPITNSAPGAEFVWMDGNHDGWIYQWKDKYPQIEKLLNPWGLLGVSGPHGKVKQWKYVPKGYVFPLGKLNMVHGDNLRARQDHSSAALQDWNCNLWYGHFHSFQAATKTDPQFQRNKKCAMAIPMLGQRNPAYGNGSANKYMQGFGYGFVAKSGNFSGYPVLVVGNKVIIEGREYTK